MKDLSSCDAVWDLLSLVADGEASPSERDIVETHVAGCEACALDLLFLRETTSVLAQTPLVAPPPDLKQAILAATIYRPTWQERLRAAFESALPAPRLQMAGGVAAVALVGLFLASALQNPPAIISVPDSPEAAVAPQPGNGAAGHFLALGDPGIRKTTGNTPAPPVRPIPRGMGRASDAGKANLAAGVVARRLEENVAPIESKAPQAKSFARISKPAPRRQSFRPQDEGRVASSTLAPKPVEESPLIEPAGMRDPMSANGAGGGPNGAEVVKNMGPEEKRNLETPETPASAPARGRYVLTASAPSGGADGLVSFADLRSALRKRGESARTVSLDLGSADRRAMVDVYKQRF